MRFFIAALLCFLSAVAVAQSDQDKFLSCRVKGDIFESAAQSRDHGMPPEVAYSIVSAYLGQGVINIDKPYLKAVVNAVYFAPEFTNAGGKPLSSQIRDMCMNNGQARYQPLK